VENEMVVVGGMELMTEIRMWNGTGLRNRLKKKKCG
jgi:hypothetical protein